jgi:hypothetical protein
VFNLPGFPQKTALTLRVDSATLTFTAGTRPYTVTVPNAVITISPAATSATTSFSTAGNEWVTTVPASGLAGNIFLNGVVLPVTTTLPGGVQNVTWHARITSATPNVTVNWKWAAAVYPSGHFSTDDTVLGVKPVDDTRASQYQNSDHAGTSESFKAYVIAGGTGGGGSNYTGSYSGTGKVTLKSGDL